MRRRAALAAVWVIGTCASVALAWTAVSAVGGQVTGPPDGGLTAGELAAAATRPVPSSSTTTTAATAPVDPGEAGAGPPVATSTRTFEPTGGTVGVTCTGDDASLGFATPRAGYATEVHDAGPQRVEVRFEGDSNRSRIVVTCAAGVPDAEIRDG